MSEEKKNEVTEEVKEVRKLTEEELEQVNGGEESIGQNKESGLKGLRINGIEWNG